MAERYSKPSWIVSPSESALQPLVPMRFSRSSGSRSLSSSVSTPLGTPSASQSASAAAAGAAVGAATGASGSTGLVLAGLESIAAPAFFGLIWGDRRSDVNDGPKREV